MTEKKKFRFPIDVHYHTLGSLSSETEYVWIVCHGYGQLSEYFIKNFDCLDPKKHFVIAPQGISKFYQRAFTGRVGATWMTSHDRETEIANYLRMIQGIYEQEISGHSQPIKTVLFGFSQGAATIGRVAVYTDLQFDALLLWGGRFPHDADETLAQNRLANKHFKVYLGNQDKYIDADQRHEHISWLAKRQLHPEVVVFEGEHKIYPEPLLRFAEGLADI